MSKHFTLTPGSNEEFHANDYEKVTKNASQYLYYPKGGGSPRFFGYCTGGCELKVFLSKPTTENGDKFFKHVKGYYSLIDQIRMQSCNNYKPSRGQIEQPIPLPPLYLDEIFEFIKKNSFWIYKFINAYVLKDIGIMRSDFYIELIRNIFVTNVKTLSTSDKITKKMLPYNILALMFGTGKMSYSNIKAKKIDFDKFLTKVTASHKIFFYNYIFFLMNDDYLDENCLGLEIIQSENFGVELEKPINLYTKRIEIDSHGLYNFIKDNEYFESQYKLSDTEIISRFPKHSTIILNNKKLYEKITNEVNLILS
jgi:hypothetical protein